MKDFQFWWYCWNLLFQLISDQSQFFSHIIKYVTRWLNLVITCTSYLSENRSKINVSSLFLLICFQNQLKSKNLKFLLIIFLAIYLHILDEISKAQRQQNLILCHVAGYMKVTYQNGSLENLIKLLKGWYVYNDAKVRGIGNWTNHSTFSG